MPPLETLSFDDVLKIHEDAVNTYGGDHGPLDLKAIHTALQIPFDGFAEKEYYPGIHQKAAALGYMLVKGNPFLDGNKRTGFMAMEAFLQLNGYNIEANTQEVVQTFVGVAAGEITLPALSDWVFHHLVAAD